MLNITKLLSPYKTRNFTSTKRFYRKKKTTCDCSKYEKPKPKKEQTCKRHNPKCVPFQNMEPPCPEPKPCCGDAYCPKEQELPICKPFAGQGVGKVLQKTEWEWRQIAKCLKTECDPALCFNIKPDCSGIRKTYPMHDVVQKGSIPGRPKSGWQKMK